MDLVIFYSRTNTTKKVSEIISEEKNAKLIEINDSKSRSGVLGYAMGALDSLLGKKTDISYEKVSLKDYETVYIGTPVWASKPTPSIMQFIDENDFDNINVVTFATMMGSGGDSTVNTMNEKIKAQGGKIKRSFALVAKDKDLKELVINALNDE